MKITDEKNFAVDCFRTNWVEISGSSSPAKHLW